MVEFHFVDAEFKHIGQLCGRLRYEDVAEITCFGLRPFVAIRKSFKQSYYKRTLIMENEVAAMFGLGGVILSGKGEPWLLTTPLVERCPLALIKEVKREVAHMLTMCDSLTGVVPDSYKRSWRFLGLMGFKISEPFIVSGVSVRQFRWE